jgi:hypothetical protein
MQLKQQALDAAVKLGGVAGVVVILALADIGFGVRVEKIEVWINQPPVANLVKEPLAVEPTAPQLNSVELR